MTLFYGFSLIPKSEFLIPVHKKPGNDPSRAGLSAYSPIRQPPVDSRVDDRTAVSARLGFPAGTEWEEVWPQRGDYREFLLYSEQVFKWTSAQVKSKEQRWILSFARMTPPGQY